MKNISLIAALLGFFGIILGAFGAHALETRLLDSGMSKTWQTAVQYNLIHSVLVYAISFHPDISSNLLRRACLAWIVGIIFFSGSLYALALGGPRWLGPITPIGGLCFLWGWAYAAFAAWRNSPQSSKS